MSANWLGGNPYISCYLTHNNPHSKNHPLTRRQKWVRLAYLGPSSDRIARELRRLGYKVGFYPVTTVGSLSQLKDRIEDEDKPGVYRIECGECRATYVGQTGRPLRDRVREHVLSAYSNHPEKSAVGLHCVAFGHDPEKLSAKHIHVCEKGSELNRLEEIETLTAFKQDKEMLLNDMSLTYSNPLIRYIIESSEPVAS